MQVNVVSPWYPDRAHPYSGVFVAKQVEAVRSLGADVTVEVPHIFPSPPGGTPELVRGAVRSLAERDAHAAYYTSEGVTHVPTPVATGSGVLGRTAAFEAGVAAKRRVLPIAADVTHAHLGLPTGHALQKIGDSPLVITEHQSSLPTILDHAEARAAYRSTILRADAFLAVSASMKTLLVDRLGSDLLDHIEVVPNIVDVAECRTRRGSNPFRSWIYVGTIAKHKGVLDLLRAFSSFHRQFEPEASLRLVGSGPLTDHAQRLAQRLGIARRVYFDGAQPHEFVLARMREADLLVHLSPSETFGIAALEAIASGTPVVALENGGSENTWGDIANACGVLLPSGATFEQVASAVAQLRDNQERLDPVLACQTVQSRFSPATVGSKLMSIYRRVM